MRIGGGEEKKRHDSIGKEVNTMAIKVQTVGDSNFVERILGTNHSKTHICDTKNNIHVERHGKDEQESTERAWDSYSKAVSKKK
jgi:hypothetical protein